MNTKIKEKLAELKAVGPLVAILIGAPWMIIEATGIIGKDDFSGMTRLSIALLWSCWLIIAIAFDSWRRALKAWLVFNAYALVIFGPLGIMVYQLSKGEMSFYGQPVQNLIYASVSLFVLVMGCHAITKRKH